MRSLARPAASGARSGSSGSERFRPRDNLRATLRASRSAAAVSLLAPRLSFEAFRRRSCAARSGLAGLALLRGAAASSTTAWRVARVRVTSIESTSVVARCRVSVVRVTAGGSVYRTERIVRSVDVVRVRSLFAMTRVAEIRQGLVCRVRFAVRGSRTAPSRSRNDRSEDGANRDRTRALRTGSEESVGTAKVSRLRPCTEVPRQEYG